MIKQVVSISKSLLSSLEESSHGAMSIKAIEDLLDDKAAMIVNINNKLTTGIMWNEDTLSFFGFHGDMDKACLDALDEYSVMIANEKGLSTIQFITPRNAWGKLLKKFNYKTSLIVYEKEI